MRKIKDNSIVLAIILLSLILILFLQKFGYKSYSRYVSDTLHYNQGIVVEISNENIEYDEGLKLYLGTQDLKVKMTEGKPDDFLSMKEVLTRRLSHLGEEKWAKPDLMIIDGGKGQLSSVMEIIEGLGVTGIDVVSLAKKHEEVFLPKQSKPVILPRNSSALFLFQRIRDEAHRFAITYHRKLRSKSMIEKKK